MIFSGNVSGFFGHESQVASCLSHSAGILKPSSSGVLLTLLNQSSICRGLSVSQEAPPFFYVASKADSTVRQDDLFPLVSPRKYLPKLVTNKRSSPEPHPTLTSSAVCSGDDKAV